MFDKSSKDKEDSARDQRFIGVVERDLLEDIAKAHFRKNMKGIPTTHNLQLRKEGVVVGWRKDDCGKGNFRILV